MSAGQRSSAASEPCSQRSCKRTRPRSSGKTSSVIRGLLVRSHQVFCQALSGESGGSLSARLPCFSRLNQKFDRPRKTAWTFPLPRRWKHVMRSWLPGFFGTRAGGTVARPDSARSRVREVPASRRWMNRWLDFIYPPLCRLCKEEEFLQFGLCGECLKELSSSRQDVCLRCSAPLGPYLRNPSGCRECARDQFAFERALTIGVYSGLLREACLEGKYSYEAPVGYALAELFWHRWRGVLEEFQPDVLVPVPRHWSDRLLSQRDLPLILGRVLSRSLGVPMNRHVLRKVIRTPRQTSLPASRRRKNLQGAFRLRRGVQLSGCRILVLDDIITTGTTAHRVACELVRSGADRVMVAALARRLGSR